MGRGGGGRAVERGNREWIYHKRVQRDWNGTDLREGREGREGGRGGKDFPKYKVANCFQSTGGKYYNTCIN